MLVGKNTGPKLPESPLEVLQGHPEPPLFSKYFGPVVFAGVGFVATCLGNWCVKRPVMSGIHIHTGMTIGGALLGKYIDDWRNGYMAERDAILRHYVSTHLEDFPKFERKKYGEVLETWVPIR